MMENVEQGLLAHFTELPGWGGGILGDAGGRLERWALGLDAM